LKTTAKCRFLLDVSVKLIYTDSACSYEARTRIGVRLRHNTYDYTELCHFLKLLFMLACWCPCCVRCRCLCMCFILLFPFLLN